jgi:signal transduction histidine kinase
VADTGPGIALDEQALIFEPFKRGTSALQAKVKGVGLGLAIARQLAELLGGTLRLKSTPGHGSCFTLSLICPTTASEAASEPS